MSITPPIVASISQKRIDNNRGVTVDNKRAKSGNYEHRVQAQLDRRKLLGGITAAGSIAISNKPLIRSVILPAHAQTSTDTSPPTLDDPNIRKRSTNPLPKIFVFGWEGSLMNLNNPSPFKVVGCTQPAVAEITVLSDSSTTQEMSYFSKIIELVLSQGSAALLAFPLACNN